MATSGPGKGREVDANTVEANMLADFVSCVAAGHRRDVRARFEQVVAKHLRLPDVRLRDVAANGDLAIGERAFSVPIPVPGRVVVLEADQIGSIGPEHEAAVRSAIHLATIVCELERGVGGLGDPGAAVAERDGCLLLGSSRETVALRQQIDRMARTDFAVLIEGESGVGKELVARQIHLWSRRARGPFVAVNCAALVETLLEAELFGIEDRTATGVRGRQGKFESADGGTLFLDEVADLSAHAQAKLLRALQEFAVERVGGNKTKRLDIRLIAATNRNLAALVAQRQFREDLYWRLNALEVRVPPLRARREDIIDLSEGCLQRYRGVGPSRFAPGAIEAMLTYEWPGNVRELERVIERAITLAEGDEIVLKDLPPALSERYAIVRPSVEGHETMRAWGSRYARLTLQRCGNNKRRACRILGISYHTLQAYLRYQPSSTPASPGTPSS
jgi:two-component system, NtrC family, response regulator HydG